MQTFVITFNAEWSNRKVPQMERDLLIMVRREGAKNVRFHREGEPPPEERPALNLACSECEKKSNGVPVGFWTSDFFSDCPDCGRREFVRKVPRGEVELRDSQIAKATQEAADAAALAALKPARPAVSTTPTRHSTKHKHVYKKDRTCKNCGRKKPGRAVNG